MTFKENCPDVRNSKVINIINELQHWRLAIKVMDPWAKAQEVQKEYDVTLTQISPYAPVDSRIVALAHTQFAQMSPKEHAKLCATLGKPLIADLKALYARKELEAQGFEVFRF